MGHDVTIASNHWERCRTDHAAIFRRSPHHANPYKFYSGACVSPEAITSQRTCDVYWARRTRSLKQQPLSQNFLDYVKNNLALQSRYLTVRIARFSERAQPAQQTPPRRLGGQ
jgi:hypothetical protein